MHNKYLRNISVALLALAVSKVAGGFSTFIIAKTLDPANYGIWLTMALFVSYSSILTLGTLETLRKQIPFHTGKGDVNAVRQLEHVVYTAIIIAAAVVLSIGSILPLFMTKFHSSAIMPAIVVMAIAASLGFPSGFYYFRFVGHQDFKTMGLLEIIRSLLNIVFVVGFSYIWGLTGAAVGFCLTEMLICLLSRKLSIQNHGRVKFIFDFRAIMNSIVIGFPITIYMWVSMLQGSIDRLVSISLLGEVSTGYYGIGIAIVSVMFLLPSSISRVLYPSINQKLGEASREGDLYRIVIFPARSLSLIMAGVVGAAVILMPVVYQIVPKYIPGLAAGQILMALSVMRLSTVNGVNFLIATNRQKKLYLLVLGSLGVGLAAAYGAVRIGWGIEGLAASTFFSGSFFTLFVWRLVFSSMGFTSSKQVKEIVKLQIPFLLLLILLGSGFLVVPYFLSQTTLFSIVYALIYITMYGSIIYALPVTRKWATEIMLMLHRSFAPKALT